MPTSTLRARLSAELIAFAWDEWAQLGVFASSQRRSTWAQDAEALIVFTLEVARDDPRLFDALLDWLVVNESLVSVRRLRALSIDSEDKALVDATLAWVGRHRRGGGPPSSVHEDVRGEPALLYRGLSGLVGEPDEAFAAHGLLKPAVEPGGKAAPPDLSAPICFAFRLRQLLGMGVRAEAVRLLLTIDAPWMTPPAVAASAGFARRNVQEALSSLHRAGVISSTTVRNEQRYSIDRSRWSSFLNGQASGLPAHRDWPHLLGALRRILRWLIRSERQELSDYLRASRTRDLLEEVHSDLAFAGIPVEYGRTAADAEAALDETVNRALTVLRSDPRSSDGADAAAPPLPRRPIAGFAVVPDGKDAYRWRLQAANGQLIAESPSAFRTQIAATEAARWFRAHAGDLRYQAYADRAGAFRWRATGRTGADVATSAESFASRSNARRAAENVRQSAAVAAVSLVT